MDYSIRDAVFEIKMDAVCWDEGLGKSQPRCPKESVGCGRRKGICHQLFKIAPNPQRSPPGGFFVKYVRLGAYNAMKK